MPEHSHTDFDQFYAEGPRWSGNPNENLVREVGAMTAGTVIDIGCGEGADVAWLAAQQWQVTGIDPVAVAIERTQQLIDAQGLSEHVELIAADLVEFSERGRTFDLVSSFYTPLPATADVAQALIKLVAPGGTLLVVHHDFGDEHPELLSPAALKDLVAEHFAEVSVSRVSRAVSHGAGAHHREDLVLRAVRA
ncbi:class I SAM-dependent methyltransferase [Corynebacterium alimapuense]|uniref:class I SAM-dependent methyltransferase n=1 Tax=Corynebacterium alimapuense TaxID=1576874 RepID=UPI00140393CA|nr:class I SAM-dependent methyltransferase [Corynebacterium alimapuense]